MTINPKATYRIGKLRSDSRASDPDPVLVQAKTLQGAMLLQNGIANWQQFFSANPLGYKNNTSLDVFQMKERGEMKHVYSGTILAGGFGQGFDGGMGMQSYGNGYNPTPIGGGLSNAMGNHMHGGMRQFPQHHAPNETMQTVFSHAEVTMHNMQQRHEAEIERVNTLNSDLRTELGNMYRQIAEMRAERDKERDGRIHAEKELDKVRNDYELRERYKKESDDTAIKLANEKLALDKKNGNALNDGSLSSIVQLISEGRKLMEAVNGQPTPNGMQTSVAPQNTYGQQNSATAVNDAAKAQNAPNAGASPFQKANVMILPNTKNGRAAQNNPQQPFANVEYK